MSENVIINLLMAIFGTAIALLFRGLFTWKGPGRIEAMRKNDLLLTDFYGRLIPIITTISPRDDFILIDFSDYRILRESQARFKHRIPLKLNELLEEMILKAQWLGKERKDQFSNQYCVQFESRTETENFTTQILAHLEEEEANVLDKLNGLELISKSFWKKIGFELKFWSDVI